jgi:hypothetical protein
MVNLLLWRFLLVIRKNSNTIEVPGVFRILKVLKVEQPEMKILKST